MENNKKKQILIVVLILLVVVSIVGITFAAFTYSKTGTSNSKQIVGDIYMHYTESNQLTIENAMPSTTYDPTKYFEFTIDGKNTNTKYDIIYDVTLNRGDNHQTRTEKLDDKFLKFTLMEKKTGESEWTTVVDSKSYNDLSSGIRVWVDNISKNQTTEITHTYRLYMWIDNSVVIGNTGTPGIDYDMATWNTDVYASVKVTVTGDFNDKEIPVQIGDKLSKAVLANVTNDNSNVDSDNVTYISGCSDEVTIDGTTCTEANKIDFNFVWYSGKLWRIVAIYPDGTMKLVTENPITAIYWGSNTTYNGSWVYQWLNEDFNDTLANKNTVLATGKQWNATETTETTKPAETTMVGGNVGLLNTYEYTESYRKANNISGKGYLNIKQNWWLITPYSSSVVHFVSEYSSFACDSPSSYSHAVRPSIYLSSGITFAGGAGTRNNPYKIGEDISAPTTNAKISSRVSGEYVSFKNELFRIVGKEGETTKIVKADYLLDNGSVLKKRFPTGITYGSGTDDTWDNYLNNTWLTSSDKTILDQGKYYLGEYGDTGISYKATICDTTNDNSDYHLTTKACDKLQNTDTITNTYTGYVGLLRVGEMFSSQLKGELASYQGMWLITPDSSSGVRSVLSNGLLSSSYPSSTKAVRPSVNLKSNIIITGGDGTKNSPFQIALGS